MLTKSERSIATAGRMLESCWKAKGRDREPEVRLELIHVFMPVLAHTTIRPRSLSIDAFSFDVPNVRQARIIRRTFYRLICLCFVLHETEQRQRDDDQKRTQSTPLCKFFSIS